MRQSAAAVERREALEGGTDPATLRDMVVFLDGCEALARTVEWTAGLAREHGAHRDGAFASTPTIVSVAVCCLDSVAPGFGPRPRSTTGSLVLEGSVLGWSGLRMA